MLRLLEEHAVHIGPPIVIFAAIAWLWLRDLRMEPEPGDGQRLAEWRASLRAHQRAPRASPRVGRLAWALLALTTGVLVTSALLYLSALDGLPRIAAVIWVHVALATLICLVAGAKLKAIGLGRLRRTLRFATPLRVAGSTSLTALLVPLLVTGVILAVQPTFTGFAANFHLLVAVWWTALAFAHVIQLWQSLRRAHVRGKPFLRQRDDTKQSPSRVEVPTP